MVSYDTPMYVVGRLTIQLVGGWVNHKTLQVCLISIRSRQLLCRKHDIPYKEIIVQNDSTHNKIVQSCD